jgi:lycopene beta-cyclase
VRWVRGRILASVTEVLVVGGGPAGRALAAECADRGLTVTLVDPAPHAPWRATYAAWLDELPAGLPPPAATARGLVIARTTHVLDRTYAVLDVPALRAHLDARLAAAGVRVLTGRVAGLTGRAADLPLHGRTDRASDRGAMGRAGPAADVGAAGRAGPPADADAAGHTPPAADVGAGGRAGRAAGPSARATAGFGGRGGPGERCGVVLTDGTWLTADVIVDAGGHRAPLSGLAGGHRAPLSDRATLDGPPGRRASRHRDAVPAGHREPALSRVGGRPGARVAAEQTAYGLVVDAATAAPFLGPDEALFMDWRPDHGEPGWPTFLYAVPLGGDAVLLEETSLARRPGLPLPVLRRRLHARLAHHGVTSPPDARVERVRFPVDRPRHAATGVLGFGAAAPLVHPATGFSVADALRLAPAVAEALATGGVPAAQRLIWSTRAVAVHRLRRIGLEALLGMPPDAVPGFFETFFALPERHRHTYLSRRDDLVGHLAAMGALFGHADTRLRRRLVTPAFRGPAAARPSIP